MFGIIDIPFTKAFVKNSFLFKNENDYQLTPCYLFAATPLLNRPLLFTIHTEHGALFSRVPLKHLFHKPVDAHYNNELLEPWGSLGERLSVLQHRYLKDYSVKTKTVGDARYLMTFSWLPTGAFEEDPEQSKDLHLLALENGQFALLPNNSCLFLDKHFTEECDWPKYKRNSEYFWANG